MADTPGYVSNSELAKSISDVVTRWNTRETQMIALLSQPEGSVQVTDGSGTTHELPSFPQLQADVEGLTSGLSGTVAGIQAIASGAAVLASQAQTAAQAAAESASTAADEASASAATAAGAVVSEVREDLAALKAGQDTSAIPDIENAGVTLIGATVLSVSVTGASLVITTAGNASDATSVCVAHIGHGATRSPETIPRSTIRSSASIGTWSPECGGREMHKPICHQQVTIGA